MTTKTPQTLTEMKAAEKRGEGRIYWFREDRQYGAPAEPQWVPQEDVESIFQPH